MNSITSNTDNAKKSKQSGKVRQRVQHQKQERQRVQHQKQERQRVQHQKQERQRVQHQKQEKLLDSVRQSIK